MLSSGAAVSAWRLRLLVAALGHLLQVMPERCCQPSLSARSCAWLSCSLLHPLHRPRLPCAAQVFQAIQEWRRMLPASEVVAQRAQGAEAAHAATLMGLRVNTHQRQNENELIAMRVRSRGQANRCTLTAMEGEYIASAAVTTHAQLSSSSTHTQACKTSSFQCSHWAPSTSSPCGPCFLLPAAQDEEDGSGGRC